MAFLAVAGTFGLVLLAGCGSIPAAPIVAVPQVKSPAAPFDQSAALFAQGQYEAAYHENQRILQNGGGAPDVALFNMGMISAHSGNPKKNYPRALLSFRALVTDYSQSPMAEPAKTWIQVLEEYQKMADEKQTMIKEKATLVQEKDKLKYTIERSRQVDVEIEKRRRATLRK